MRVIETNVNAYGRFIKLKATANRVPISEDDRNAMQKTLYLNSVLGIKEYMIREVRMKGDCVSQTGADSL